MLNDTELQQLYIYVGTQAKIDEARQQGTIGQDDFVVVTDAPEFALQSSVQAIQVLIPSQATAQNQLADKNYVDNSTLPSSTKYGASFTLSINSTDYKVTATLKDQDGNTLGTQQVIDLPLESVVVGGSYDSTNKKIVLTLQNGNTIDVPVGDLVAGLQTEITAQNKLSSDLVDDTNKTNKFVTTQEKTTWNNKQNAINDLDAIRSGASAGATAVQPSELHNSTITITQGGTTKGSFTLNQSSDETIALDAGGSDGVPYSGATQAVDLNAQDLKNVDNLAVGTSTVDSNEKILSVGQNRIVTNNNNGLFISSTTSQTRKGMYGVPMALEIQFNSNNQAYSYPLGFHDMNSNNNGGQFLFTSFSSAIGAASAGDVMVENDKGGLIFNTGSSKSGAKMRFTVGNWQSTPQLTLTANSVGIKNLNPSSSYALDVSGIINASTDVRVNGTSVALPSQSGNSGKFLTTNGSNASWAEVQAGGGNVEYTSGGGGTEYVDLSTLYVDSQGATYGFSYDSMSNTIKNDNVQVDDSFAYGYIELNLENDGDITISFSQDSEQNYDFGEISELDEYLNQDNYEDTDYVAWSGKDYSSISDSITFSNVTAGYHFFTIKYVKDSSSETGSDTFEITGIEISGGSSGSLIDTDTQQEIPLSQINDMPQVLQDIRDSIPDTSNFVTTNTKQMITAPKAITGTDVPWGSDQVQKNLFMAVSDSNTTSAVEWIGRSMLGANNLTFLMGTINRMAALGAHSWTSAKQGTGAAWADIYINPDGDKAVKIGGSPMVGRPSIMVIQNLGQTTTGTVKINRRALLTQSALYKDVACWDDNVSKFNNDAGYITASYVNNPTITFTQGGVSKGSITLNQSSDETIALDAGGGTDDWGQSLQGDVVINNTYICAPQKCYANQRITSFSAPNATEVDLNNCFSICENLQSFSTPNLETIGPNGLQSCCAGCSSLTSVASFDKLKTLKRSAMYSFANGCILLEDVYFPALTTSSFVDATNQFNSFWSNTGTTKTHTMHFPSNLQTTIQGLTGYPNFGGTSGYVVLAFDLPATS